MPDPREILSADYVRRLAAPLLLLGVLAGCAQSDAERLDRQNVEGVDCVIVRNGFGRPQRTDCNWYGGVR